MSNKMDFTITKWCNCFRNANSPIIVKCYDYDIEAINAFKKDKADMVYTESRLVELYKFLPEFINNIIVKNAFRPNVVYSWNGTYRDYLKIISND